MLTIRTLLFIVTGSIASVKVLVLASLLLRQGYQLRFLLSEQARKMVTVSELMALGGGVSILKEAEKEGMAHIFLSRESDLLLVMPATANILAKMAQGIADDFPSTVLLASNKKIMVVPAMNPEMWEHPATQVNAALLRARGVMMVEPVEGMTACGEWGVGRMAEPAIICDHIADFFIKEEKRRYLKNYRIMVTAGPTQEKIDAVRYLSNHSSGLQGYAVARALSDYGAEISLVSGPVALARPENVRFFGVTSAEEMRQICHDALPYDVAICVAAVADWRVETPVQGKIKKKPHGAPSLRLIENIDILSSIGHLPKKKRPSLVIGFCAEKGDPKEEAVRKRKEKKCDWVIANDISDGVFGKAYNRVSLATKDSYEDWKEKTKDAIAERLALKIIDHLGAHQESVV